MDDAVKVSAGVKIPTKSFKKQDLERIKKIILQVYDIDTRIHSAGVKDQYVLYFPKSSMPKLSSLIKFYLVPSMHYKLMP